MLNQFREKVESFSVTTASRRDAMRQGFSEPNDDSLCTCSNGNRLRFATLCCACQQTAYIYINKATFLSQNPHDSTQILSTLHPAINDSPIDTLRGFSPATHCGTHSINVSAARKRRASAFTTAALHGLHLVARQHAVARERTQWAFYYKASFSDRVASPECRRLWTATRTCRFGGITSQVKHRGSPNPVLPRFGYPLRSRDHQGQCRAATICSMTMTWVPRIRKEPSPQDTEHGNNFNDAQP
jgi:hypothetical protein